MEKQTSVEWFFWKLYVLKEVEYESIMELYEQAKAMEKEQSECICVNVIEMILDELEQGKEINSKEIFEKCYKETFKLE